MLDYASKNNVSTEYNVKYTFTLLSLLTTM